MKRVFKITVKVVLALLLLSVMGFGVLYLVYNKAIPKTQERGIEADILASKMLDALDYETYKRTRFFEWSFRNGAHRFIWDKTLGLVDVRWKTNVVHLNLNTPSKSKVYQDKVAITGTKKEALTAEALALFNNDSFWLVAPYKVFDKGTERKVATLADGTLGLLVTYTKGGTTPGDQYLWKLAPNGFPESYQMWVQRIPIGGLKASWDDWLRTESGVYLPKTHQLGPITLDMGDVRAYN